MSIRKNTIINFAGLTFPILVSLISIPITLKIIGSERYGLLILVWTLLGYFAFVDFGLPKAMSNRIARIEKTDGKYLTSLVWSVSWVALFLGVIGGALLYMSTKYFFFEFSKLSSAIAQETAKSIFWISLLLPLSILTSILTGILDGVEKFARSNIIHVTTGTLVQLAPIISNQFFGVDLEYIFILILAFRLVLLVVLAVLVKLELNINHIYGINFHEIRSMSRYGFWVTISSFMSPLLETADRIVLTKVSGVQAVPYYSIPFSMLDKMRVVPRALGRTVFPILSKSSSTEAHLLGTNILKRMIFVLAIPSFLAILLAEPLLRLWMGEYFAAKSYLPAQILTIGFWMNSPAFIAVLLLQGQGKPKMVATLHMIEILPFLGVMWVAVDTWGIAGAAGAWSTRVACDAIVLYYLSGALQQLLKMIVVSALFIASAAALSTLKEYGIYIYIISAVIIFVYMSYVTILEKITFNSILGRK